MRRHPFRLAALVVAFVFVSSVPAHAGATLFAPDTLDLKRGTSASDEAAALSFVAVDDDQFYAIAPTKKDGKFGIQYIVTFEDVPAPLSMSFSIRARTGANRCSANVALYRWRAKIWVSDGAGINTTEDFASFDPTKPAPYTKNGVVKGRVKCSSKTDFHAFETDRVRLIVDTD